MTAEHDVTFPAMGSHVRLLIGESGPDLPPAAVAAAEAQSFVADFEATLSRFDRESELSALNRDRRERVPASPLLRRAVAAGLVAAEQSGGLVDPTLVEEIERTGYVASRAWMAPASLPAALAQAPARRPAGSRPEERWRQWRVDEEAGEIVRPPGHRFDSGGSGKGLAADLLAIKLAGYRSFVVDCGGDIRVGGVDAPFRPRVVQVEHPLSGKPLYAIRVSAGGVATSGLDRRIWRDACGRYAHHLLDPATGEPAWTGLIATTALAATALEAETLAKAALLSGPARGAELLRRGGGLLVHDSGRVELVGSLAGRPRVRLPRPDTTLEAAA
ncbi:MAG TPA: FAD:protein FMN transferase [Solirubrobacterales bacterium]|nr:FAD:protein FMN transferase [Solirubrobacterales bacterium]